MKPSARSAINISPARILAATTLDNLPTSCLAFRQQPLCSSGVFKHHGYSISGASLEERTAPRWPSRAKPLNDLLVPVWTLIAQANWSKQLTTSSANLRPRVSWMRLTLKALQLRFTHGRHSAD